MISLGLCTHAGVEWIAIEIDGVGARIESEILLVSSCDHRCAEWHEIGRDA